MKYSKEFILMRVLLISDLVALIFGIIYLIVVIVRQLRFTPKGNKKIKGEKLNMEIDKLYNELISLKYRCKFYGSGRTDYYETEVVNKDAREIFRVALADVLNKQLTEYNRKIAILEAKVFAYEAILKNSNFAMAVIDDKSDLEEEEENDETKL